MTVIEMKNECRVMLKHALRDRRRELQKAQANTEWPGVRASWIAENKYNQKNYCFFKDAADPSYPSKTGRMATGYYCYPRRGKSAEGEQG